MIVGICEYKGGIEIHDGRAVEYCYKKIRCEWLNLDVRKGGKGANGQNGRPVPLNGKGRSANEDTGFFCEYKERGQIRNFKGGKKAPRFLGRR